LQIADLGLQIEDSDPRFKREGSKIAKAPKVFTTEAQRHCGAEDDQVIKLSGLRREGGQARDGVLPERNAIERKDEWAVKQGRGIGDSCERIGWKK
jgi:hypothetical protein